MGILKKKKKTYVNTSISRLIDDKDIPDQGKMALFDYLFDDKNNRNGFVKIDRSYSDYLALASANSIAAKLGNGRKWAVRNYQYGVPEGNVIDPTLVDMNNVMDEYLQKVLGKPVRLSYSMMAPANALHLAWQILVEEHDYNPDTNSIGSIPGSKLEDIQIRYCKDTAEGIIDPDTVAQYGLPATYGETSDRKRDYKRIHTLAITDEAAEHDYAHVTYSVVVNGKKEIKTLQFNFLKYEWSGSPPEDGLDDSDTENIDPDAIAPIIQDTRAELDYIMVQYFVQEAPGIESIGYFTYEYGSNEIPELEKLFNVRGQLGRYYPNIYFRLWGTNLASDPYKDTDEYKSSRAYCKRLSMNYREVSDQLHKAVGSLEDVTQMLISTQLPVNSDDPLIMDYFYEYFYALYNSLPSKFANTAYSSINTDFVNGYAKTGMSVEVTDKVYSSNISFSSIGYVDEKKVIGKIGTVTRKYDLQVIQNSKRGGFRGRSVMPYHVFTKQLTADTCRVITIYGLNASQRVTGGHTTTASRDSGNLIIPLDDAVARFFPLKDRSALYSKSLVIIINTLKVVKQKWYETGLFKAVMFIIAVIVSVFTNGAGMGIYAVMYAVVQTLVIGLVVSIVVKFLVEKMNMKLGGLFAVVAVIMIIVGAGAQIGNLSSVMGMTSSQFMMAANVSIMVATEANKLEMNAMIKAHNQFGMEMAAKTEELEELQREMNPNMYLNPAYLMADSIRGPDIRVGEILNDFLIRTLSVDAGLSTLNTIPNMVALTVRLPTYQETLAKIRRPIGEQYV